MIDAAFSPDGRRSPPRARTASRASGTRAPALAGEIRADRALGRCASARPAADWRCPARTASCGSSMSAAIVVAEIRGHAGRRLRRRLPGGRLVVSVGEDGTLRTWCRPRRRAPGRRAAGADGSASARTNARRAGTDGAVRVFDLATGASTSCRATVTGPRRATPPTASSSRARRTTRRCACGTSRAGRRLVPRGRAEDRRRGRSRRRAGGHRPTGGPDARKRRRQPAHPLRGHRARSTTHAFSPDGKHLMTASEDKTVRLSATADGSLERVLRGHDKTVINVAFSRDGQRIATTDTDGAVRIWSPSGPAARRALRPRGPVNSAEFDRAATARDNRQSTARSASGAPPAGSRWPSSTATRRRPQRPLQLGRQARAERGRRGRGPVDACEVCGSFDDALAVARSRLERRLSAADRERQRLLSGTG